MFQTQLQQGFLTAAIAAAMGRTHFCVARELARIGWRAASVSRLVGPPTVAGGYSSSQAHIQARRTIGHADALSSSLWPAIRYGTKSAMACKKAYRLSRLPVHWDIRMSPSSLCHETIYQAIYAKTKAQLHSVMIALHLFGHIKRRPRSCGIDRRGQNENTKGLLRQYLTKGFDLFTFSQLQLDDFAWKLNTRHRKSLDWKCPAELFITEDAFDFKANRAEKLNHVALGH